MEPMRDTVSFASMKGVREKEVRMASRGAYRALHKLDELRLNASGCCVPFDTGRGSGGYTASREIQKLQK